MRAMEKLVTNYLATNDFVKLVHGAHSIMPRLRFSKSFQSSIGDVVHAEMSCLPEGRLAHKRLLILDEIVDNWFNNGKHALLLRVADKKDILLVKVKTDWDVVVRDGIEITRTRNYFSHPAILFIKAQYDLLAA